MNGDATAAKGSSNRVMSFWVYILRCADGSYYTGHTDSLEKRLYEHESGAVPGYTSNRRPVRLEYACDFETRDEALGAELAIKAWSRAKKEAVMRNEWTSLSALARRQTPNRRR